MIRPDLFPVGRLTPETDTMTRLLRSLRRTAAAAAGLLATAGPAAAGWDNVFQVTCHDCKPRARSSYFRADDCPPEKKVEYQRSYYYEPVTVMKPERYTEEVPTQVKSFYWEPVTRYTYTSYYDPCTGQCQQLACPKTCYVRKEQCNTVMRYVERVRMVPVQVQRKVEVTRPVVTYYGPEVRRYVQDDCELPAAGAAGPSVERIPGGGPTVVPDRIPSTDLPTGPSGGTSRPRSSPALPPGKVNAHTTSRAAATLRGEIVAQDQVTPRPGAKLVFVKAANHDAREYATADAFGGFDVKLPAGEWFVYLGDGQGKATMHTKISVAAADSREFKVVSR
jgi:hypothetical protein